jgi:hypothetical protein
MLNSLVILVLYRFEKSLHHMAVYSVLNEIGISKE